MWQARTNKGTGEWLNPSQGDAAQSSFEAFGQFLHEMAAAYILSSLALAKFSPTVDERNKEALALGDWILGQYAFRTQQTQTPTRRKSCEDIVPGEAPRWHRMWRGQGWPAGTLLDPLIARENVFGARWKAERTPYRISPVEDPLTRLSTSAPNA